MKNMDNSILKGFETDERVKKWMEKVKECNEKALKWQKKADEASGQAKEYHREIEGYISSKKLEQAQALEKNAKKYGVTLEELTSALEKGDFSDVYRKMKESDNSSNDPDANEINTVQ
jgi:uncharacterized coiled-coil DUF342 family protein